MTSRDSPDDDDVMIIDDDDYMDEHFENSGNKKEVKQINLVLKLIC